MSTKENNSANVFDEIAESWYRLRHWSRFRAELGELAERWQKGRLLNIGCAHGPDFLPFKNNFELWGLDSSPRMISMAVRYADKFKYDANLLVADAVNLPYEDRSFDFAIAVAAYHHIRGEKYRENAFRELRRVLRPGGEVFITVWNRWQPGFWFKGKEVIVPWKTKNGELMRYHYLFTYREIEDLVRGIGFTIIRTYPEAAYRMPIKFFSGNICVLASLD